MLSAPSIVILFRPVLDFIVIVPFFPLGCHIRAFTTLWRRWLGSKKRRTVSSC